MRRSTPLTLAALGIAALGAGWWFGTGPGDEGVVAGGTLAFPGLAARLAEAAEVDVTHQGATLRIVLKDGAWTLPAKGGYPIRQARLRAVLTGLTELRLTEPRTADPAEYPRLGVDDPQDATAAGAELLRVADAAGHAVAELIVGHRRVRTQGNTGETVYVRRPGEAQSWLGEGEIGVDADPQTWIERDIADIPHDRVAAVSAGPLEFARRGEALALVAPAEHPRLDDSRVEDVARGLETLTLLDVRPVADVPGERLGRSRFTLADGGAVEATLFRVPHDKDADIWVELAASGPGSEALARRVQGWAYQVGAWKQAALLPTLDDLKAVEATPK